MSLGLLGEYDSDGSSDIETPPPGSKATPTTSIAATSNSNDCSPNLLAPNETRSYFVDSYSDDSTSTTSGSTADDDNDCDTLQGEIPPAPIPLPLPDLQRIHSGKAEATPGSVFSNPYLEEEDAKLAVLKKHVTLAPTEEPVKDEKQRHKRMRRKRFIRAGDQPDQGQFNDQDSSIGSKKVNKVRTGLSQGLIPSQKYMKLHQKQQANERPWTLK